VLNGRYRLERLLGSGGFADVYLATDLGPLGRRVAVKVLHPHLVRQQDFLDRFRREAATIAQLKHPHILDVYDFGEAEGALYLVMPFVAGGTLDERLKRGTPVGGSGRLTPAQTAAYLKQIAAALDYAHARRIVHRDLKPQNFLVDEGDNLLLADFGIAKLMQEASQATGGSAIVGTLPYMAPELFRGEPGPSSDLYALGCMAFQFLTGTLPYTGTTEQLMYAHSFAPIPTLAERGGAGLPPALEAVLSRALAKRPEDRYPSAGEFARAFESVATGTATAAYDVHAARTLVGQPDLRSVPRPVTPPTSSPSTPTVAVPSAPVRQSSSRRLVVFGAIGATVLLLAIAVAFAARGQGVVTPTATLSAVAMGTATMPATAAASGAVSVAPTALLAPTARSTPALGLTSTSGPVTAATPSTPRPIGTPASFQGEIIATLPIRFSSLAWSPDGQTLATRGAEEGTVQLWGTDGRALATLKGSGAPLVWSPDGRILAGGSSDDTIRLWGADGRELATVVGFVAIGLQSLAWSPDSRTLAGTGDDNSVRIWGTDGRVLATLVGHTDTVHALAWSPDGRTLASGSSDTTVRLWGTNGQSVAVLTGHSQRVRVLAWSPDGRVLASGTESPYGGVAQRPEDRTVRLWGADGRIVAIPNTTGYVRRFAWSPDSSRIAWQGTYNGTVEVFSPDGRFVATLSGHNGEVFALAWSPDGQFLASGATAGSNDRTIRLWGADGRAMAVLEGFGGGVELLAWSPDGRILAASGTLRTWLLR
jgi:eukaryotic-like serine/threonine-protein kinase